MCRFPFCPSFRDNHIYMKYCPICKERYDEDIIRFCTKDGTPLIEEEQPNFTIMPSENIDADDDGEKTVVRRKNAAADTNLDERGIPREESERIVIPTTPPVEQHVRPRAQAYYPPVQEPNTAKTVFLTILGTVVVLGLGVLLFWMLQRDKSTNVNVNFNSNIPVQNTNLNTNFGFDSNFNFNASPSVNTNFNMPSMPVNLALPVNLPANTRTPSPTPTPRPTVSPSASPTPDRTGSPSPTATPRPAANLRPPPPTARPTLSPTPRTGPRPGDNSRPPGDDER